MLVLTRKVDDGIVVEGGVTIRIVSIKGKRVEIGIEAPGKAVVREELLAK